MESPGQLKLLAASVLAPGFTHPRNTTAADSTEAWFVLKPSRTLKMTT